MPGFADGIEGAAFADQLRRQATRFGAELLQAQAVVRVRSEDDYRCVCTADDREYSARALLIASGSRYRRLGIPGEEDYIGAGVHFCAACDGPFYRDQPVVVIGSGNSATEESLFLVDYVSHVTLLVRGEALKASQVLQEKALSHAKIDVRWQTEALAFHGQGGKLKSVTMRDKQANVTEELFPGAVFVFIGLTPNSGYLSGSGVRLDRWGFVATGHDLGHGSERPAGVAIREPGYLETSLPGVYAAGDVRAGSTKQVASAAGEGATAALLIRAYLKGG